MGAGLLGAFSTMALTDSLSALLFTGCLGAFTTFSTFSVEAAQLWERRAYRQLGLYVILTLAGCPLLFGMGFMLMNAF